MCANCISYHRNSMISTDEFWRTFRVKLGDGSKVALNLHDSSGQVRYRPFTNTTSYHEAEVLIYVFDVTSKKSLRDFDDWKKTIISSRKSRGLSPISLGIVAFGTKIDSTDRVISTEEANKWCETKGIRVRE